MSMTTAEKVELEARLTVIEHLLSMQIAAEFLTSSPDPVEDAQKFHVQLRQSLETPTEKGLPPEQSALISGELGDQADRLGKGIVAMVQHRSGKHPWY